MSERIFGFHPVDSLLRHEPQRVTALRLQSGRRDKRMQALEALARNQGIAPERVSRDELDRLVDGRHQGVVAEVEPGTGATTLDEKALIDRVAQLPNPLVLVLDGVTDPHNLGACLRSADAAGVAAVVVPKNRSAELTPVARKVACGAAEVLPLVRVTNLARTLEALKAAGLWVVGTTGDTDTVVFDQDLSGPTVLVMGAEGEGMRRLTRDACDHLVRLPMVGSVESLNVSVATGICLFECLRQRQSRTTGPSPRSPAGGESGGE